MVRRSVKNTAFFLRGGRFFLSVFLFMIFSITSFLAEGAVMIVDLNGTGDYTEIQSAIDAASDGDTLLVRPGEYMITEPITFLGKEITLRGELGSADTTIRMSESPSDPARASVVLFENGESEASVRLGLTLTGGRGRGERGGAVYCRDSFPTLVRWSIETEIEYWARISVDVGDQ
jgi:hypothetical protein